MKYFSPADQKKLDAFILSLGEISKQTKKNKFTDDQLAAQLLEQAAQFTTYVSYLTWKHI